ncbi:MAG: Hsp70 family protein, partial [Cellvibrionales bacterium]|nr:Hsp70 family protein [Cellvibrionales bacterium]
MTDYFIGIDLGTTHCALAYVKRDSTLKANAFATFNIPQLVGPGEIAKRPLLPCFRYHAGDEIHPNDRTLPFDAKLSEDIDHAIIGEWAKRLGTKTSSRLVTSAKSWLTLSQNCNIACLPFNETQTIDKVSPLMATASYLNYLRAAWDYEHPNSPLAKQTLVITIPASFDEGARQATAEAAGIAGLSNVSLLEEPQAACYHWLSEHQAHDTEQRHEKLLLVCDIGGGTTDLSLLKISNNEGKTQLHRIAVGDHLMLGGDNMDLALAAKALSKTSSPSHSKVSALSSAAQAAKETLLSENSPETASLTLLGQGRK